MLLKFHFFKPQLKASTILKKFQSQKHKYKRQFIEIQTFSIHIFFKMVIHILP